MRKASARIPFLASLYLLLAGCAETPASRPVMASQTVGLGSRRLEHVKDGFYRDEAGYLFEQKRYLTGEADPEFLLRYDSTLLLKKAGERVELPLTSTIDLATYHNLGSSLFSRDKNRVYYSYNTSGGGFRIVVNGANPATFRASPDAQYGFDDKHGFFCEQPLHGLHLNQRQLLYGDTVAHFITYVKDNQHVFYQNTPVPGADAPSFRLVHGQAWEAEDKNHRCCGQRLR